MKSLASPLALALALAAAACDPGAGSPAGPPDPDPAARPGEPGRPGAVEATRGGTRLAAVFAAAADGTSQFLHWRDTRLEVACRFQSMSDGQTRCLPEGEAMASVKQDFFADAACTVRVVELAPDFAWFAACPLPRFATASSQGRTCLGETIYYRVKGRVTPGTVYRTWGHGCVPVEPQLDPGSLGLFSVEAIPSTTFVAGALVQGEVAGGVAPVSLVGEDGARAVVGLRDAAGGFDCALRLTSDGLRCVPADAPLVGYAFADPQCKTPAAMALTCLQSLRPSVPFGVAVGYANGETITRIYGGGDRLAASFAGSTADCRPGGTALGAFAVGGEVPPARFVAGTTDLARGAGGLVRSMDHVGGWSLPGPRPLRNPELGDQDCFFAPTSDGVVRCLPPPEPLPLFSDPQCTKLLSANQRPALTLLDQSTCPARARVLALGDRHAGAVYRREGSGCAFAFTQPPGPTRGELFSFAAELPPERFVAMPLVER
jgi:hypothetical protein